MAIVAALHVLAPTSYSAPQAVSSSSTVAIALPTVGATAVGSGGGVARKIWIKADAKTWIIFGDSTVVAASSSLHGYLTADIDYVMDVPAGVTHYRAITTSSSNVYIAPVS